MVKQRTPVKKKTTQKASKTLDKKAEVFGAGAERKGWKKPSNWYKSINIPFTEEDYNRLIKAAEIADRKPTEFMKKAIRDTVAKTIKKG